jgi:hypothetical protein
MELKTATEWVLAQALAQDIDLKNDGYAWDCVVDEAVEQFDVDIEQLCAALCSALSLEMPPPSEHRHVPFEAIGLKMITDPAETARYRAMAMAGRKS